jgi:hypothetical protein
VVESPHQRVHVFLVEALVLEVILVVLSARKDALNPRQLREDLDPNVTPEVFRKLVARFPQERGTCSTQAWLASCLAFSWSFLDSPTGEILVAGAIEVPAPVQIGYAGNFYFQFTALAGHFDGEGSVINFASIPKANGARALNVNAAIVIDRGVLNAGNQLAAHGQWYQFAGNMCRGLWKKNASSCNWPALYPPV